MTIEKWVENTYKKIENLKLSEEKKENLKKELVTCESWDQVYDIKHRYKLSVFKKSDDKWFEENSKRKTTCDCGCRVIIPPKVDRIICRWCKKWVYKDEKTAFRYKVLEEKKKAERDD